MVKAREVIGEMGWRFAPKSDPLHPQPPTMYRTTFPKQIQFQFDFPPKCWNWKQLAFYNGCCLKPGVTVAVSLFITSGNCTRRAKQLYVSAPPPGPSSLLRGTASDHVVDLLLQSPFYPSEELGPDDVCDDVCDDVEQSGMTSDCKHQSADDNTMSIHQPPPQKKNTRWRGAQRAGTGKCAGNGCQAQVKPKSRLPSLLHRHHADDADERAGALEQKIICAIDLKT